MDRTVDSVARIPSAFPTIPEEKQPAPGVGLTFLVVGLDTRSDVPTTGHAAGNDAWRMGAARSDTMMLLHLPADRRRIYGVSLPRDSWVNIPRHGQAKLNAAYSWGATPLTIETVQNLTGVRIDHVAVVDWNGFTAMTDAVGGVDITTSTSKSGSALDRPVGTHHLNGAEALEYVRERHSLPRGDLDRTKRQQHFLRALVDQILSPGTLTSPTRLNALLDTFSDVVSVDDRLSNADLRSLIWSLTGLRSRDTTFVNVPISGLATVRGQSVVQLDRERAAPLWQAMREDKMGQYFASHPKVDSLGGTVH
ncbi:LCP family protein [Streptomyces sp. NPDC054841]